MLLNNELELALPDGFREMTAEELADINFYKGPASQVITDPERHIVISTTWKKSGFASMMVKPKDVAKKMEVAVRKAMRPFGYELEAFIQENVGGEPAEGFRYYYMAEGIDMVGESFSVKWKKTFYYIHCYLRKELQEESLAVLEELFHESRWDKNQ